MSQDTRAALRWYETDGIDNPDGYSPDEALLHDAAKLYTKLEAENAELRNESPNTALSIAARTLAENVLCGHTGGRDELAKAVVRLANAMLDTRGPA